MWIGVGGVGSCVSGFAYGSGNFVECFVGCSRCSRCPIIFHGERVDVISDHLSDDGSSLKKVLSLNREHDIQSTTRVFLQRVERPFFLSVFSSGKGSPRTSGGRCARFPYHPAEHHLTLLAHDRPAHTNWWAWACLWGSCSGGSRRPHRTLLRRWWRTGIFFRKERTS